ncbi:MAG: hypothetical protein M1834_000349 [Cirrosporium novae-zelandiae]|nr:MAG: hypothetical protein M1834_000349 [Cirrosporium novae-zelandiae]
MSLPYPAATKQANGLVGGLTTDVMSTAFADKIMITIHVPLDSSSPLEADQYIAQEAAQEMILPLPHLTPKTLLGGASQEREMVGHLYARQIASAIVRKNPEEKRLVVFGFGFDKAEHDRESFFDLLDLVMQCI